MKWLPAENELGREQRVFLNKVMNTERNESVAGFPGSGKTVVLLYAVVYLTLIPQHYYKLNFLST